MKEVTLPQGTIRYRDSGAGEPIVFVHGLLANGELWREMAPRLASEHRVIVPDWPMGSQELALNEGTDLSPPGLAAIVAAFLDALDLQNVTLVGNDTGGAVCQLVAVHHPQRIGKLVLTPCDAYTDFPPLAFKPLRALTMIPGALAALSQLLRIEALRRSPLAYGWLMKRYDPQLSAAWLEPSRSNPAIRREAAAILAGMDKRHTLEAASHFGELTIPVLLIWAQEDRFFKLGHAERMAREIPGARLERVADSYTFVSLDQPARTAELIGSFAREHTATVA